MPDPLDLARCRALCDEAEARAELRLTTASQVREIATALRAACAEVERLRERIAGAEAGIIGKVTARMGWIDMTTAEELIVYLEEQRAIRREASHVTKCERPPLMLDAGEDLDLQPTCCGEYGVKRMAYCGGCPLDEALAAYVGNPAQRRIVLDRFTTLRAHLAAARGEAVEEAIRWAWANHERFHVDSEDEVVRDALAALLPRGPGAATGTGVG